MRLWSLHPSLLDRTALVAGWREGLLAQRVLTGTTKGYTRHPQLEPFRATPAPLDAIGHYLLAIRAEATERGYRSDASRVLRADAPNPGMPITQGQLAFELLHLRQKCAVRDADWLPRIAGPAMAAPSFVVVPGPIAGWERP